jgi:hypothetical protein
MKPIIFNPESVRAILDGRKTQSRRVIKNAPKGSFWERPHLDDSRWYWVANLETPSIEPRAGLVCPYGIPGGKLWVRETFMETDSDPAWDIPEQFILNPHVENYLYRADLTCDTKGWGWQSPLYMPKEASRITLEIKDVRVERLQDITNSDALNEGVELGYKFAFANFPNYTLAYKEWEKGSKMSVPPLGPSPKMRYEKLWNSINAKKGFGFDTNPWVWAIEFEVT